MSSISFQKIPHFHKTSISQEEALGLIPNLSDFSDDSTESLKAYVLLCDQRIEHMMMSTYPPFVTHGIRSRMVDQLIGLLFRRELSLIGGQGKITLAATGGYGRQEMSLLSDIDILMIHDAESKALATDIMQKILYVLWDLKFEVGHAVRDLQECHKLMQSDHTIATTMLDLRCLFGSEELYDQVVQIREKLLNNSKFCKQLLQFKITERADRLRKYGGSVFLLEPHIKEGEGGLRDFQLLRWLARICGFKDGLEGLLEAGWLESDDLEALTTGFEYFLHLRNKLHVLLKRKNDQLNFDAQRTLAADLGFQDGNGSLAVEKFMQIYYSVAENNKYLFKNLVQRFTAEEPRRRLSFLSKSAGQKLDDHFQILNGKIAVMSNSVFIEDPKRLITVFQHVQATGYGLHFTTRQLITHSLNFVDDAFRLDESIQSSFRNIMGNFRNLGKTLFAMHEVHFFDLILPEFLKVRNRMQHDAYHVYTIDTHSIFAVEELSRLECDPEYQRLFPEFYKVMHEIKRKDLLSLAVLYHDVGKGQGGSHSVVGAKMADKAMHRLGYSDDDSEIVEFQVLSHLLMPHLSQRRDLEDLHMISEFAKAMRSIEMLNILFVLTWADIRAVSNEAWTDWKGRLLISLYDKTKRVMESEKSSEDYIKQRVKEVRTEILRRMQNKVDAEHLQKFLASISPRYVVAHSDDEIYEHFHLLTGHDDSHFLFVEKEIQKDSVSEILIYTLVNPRVIPLVTGVMLSLDINILSMENFLLSDGHVFIKMTVQSSRGLSLRETALTERLRSNLHDVFVGIKNVDDLIAKRKKPDFLMKKPVQRLESSIKVDNDVSAYYTVIDVFAHDRLGLLYDIVRCLVENGCYVDVCKISTKVEQVVDSFYVKDIFGHKITSKDKLNDVKRALMEVLNRESAVDNKSGFVSVEI